MLKVIGVSLISLFLASPMAFADKTVAEGVEARAKDVGRAGKKVANRAGEKVCSKSDAECLARKAKNRADEKTGEVMDKAEEAKDKID